ncbi:hypothetical protein PG275_09925 [Riemerella anatipestifer]|uniref:RHS repeat domain-containing protein n=1 Tax=Riemerella anatipestifer TaxID=34085 RepID=UPI002A8A9FDD|nr:hypothetical protein [Riemerella anatipestifer]
MYCQTVIKSKNKFRGFVGPTTETRRSDDGAVRSKKRLPKWQKHPHALSILKDTTTPKPRTYEYDGNGNPISYEGFKDFRVMVWDEENRLQGLNDNGKLHLYTYDHTGERAVKSSAESQKTVINGVSSAVIVHAENYTAYVNPYFVVNKGKFTKHYFEGTSRIVSKLGEGTFHQPTGLTAGGIDYIKQSAKIQEAIDNYVRGLNIPPGPPTQHGIYGTPDFTGVEYPSIDWSDISQDQEPPEGWPRPPKFNEPGDVPGPPVQYGDPVKPDNVKGGFGYVDNGIEEKNLYYYHPDHLGSSSYITDKDGNISQHTEYIAFGEILFDEHKVSRRMPYLFNGKELDSETGLYYYGARYYDPRVSLWLNVDPLVSEPNFLSVLGEEDIIEDNGGGIFNPDNLSVYSYSHDNPVMLSDPDGRCPTCLVGAIVGAATDYGIQVASNYISGKRGVDAWTDNISLSSIALSAAEGALTQGGSALRKAAVSTTVMIAKNTIDINTTKGVSVEKNVRNIAKNTIIDASVGATVKGIGNLAKTKGLNKLADKVHLNSNNKAKNFIQKTTGLNSKQSREFAKKWDVRGVSKQLRNGINNIPNKTLENMSNSYIKYGVDKFKEKTNE